MKSFLLAAIVLIQAGPQSVGVVTGVVRGANGMPTPAVRVYAIGVRDSGEALDAGPAPLEGLTQSDAAGRYRLEVTPGRYYIAAGSVNAPTFYPGTTDATAARIVSVTSRGLVEAIDFSSFVPAARSSRVAGVGTAGSVFVSGVATLGSGFVSGVLRYPDGALAAGIPVVATSAALVPGGAAPSPASMAVLVGNNVVQLSQINSGNPSSPTPVPPSPPPAPPSAGAVTIRVGSNGLTLVTSTDATGRYAFPNFPNGTFYIAAGYAESSTIYPGATDLREAKTITTIASANVNTLDFTVTRPPTVSVAVRGRLMFLGDSPAGGASVELLPASSPVSVFGLPSISPGGSVVSAHPDGRFEFLNVYRGSYVLKAYYPTVRVPEKNVVVTDQSLEVDLFLPAYMRSGRLFAEDGTALPELQELKIVPVRRFTID